MDEQCLVVITVSELHVLDAGCGTGNYSHALLDAGVGKISAFDASAGMLGHATKKLFSFVDSGRVTEIKRGRLPAIPFDNAIFDAVMFNCVIHHLDEGPENYPNVGETLKDARRVLVQGGALCIITTLPEQVDGMWFYNLNKDALTRGKARYPNRHIIQTMLKDAGFRIVNEVPILGADWSSLYWKEEGPLDKAWRDHESYWSNMTESELNAVIANVMEMKANSTLYQYMTDHDKSATSGHYTLISAAAI